MSYPKIVPELPPLRVLALMSGTSIDGVDAVLARFAAAGGRLQWQVLARDRAPYPPALRERLARALDPARSDVLLLTELHTEVAEVYAELAARVAEAHPCDVIALSGQTVYHIPRLEPERGWRTLGTLQLGEASYVLERCAVPVISDFRQGDMAAGGQGAPLVSFGDLLLYGEPGRGRAVQNLGGIANLTYLPPDGDPERVLAFDTGPANCLLDEVAERRFGLPFDEGGQLAAAGRVHEALLARLLEHPYLALPPPKTTGRELFNSREIARFVAPEFDLEALSGEDLLATLTAFTAESIARSYREAVRGPLDEVLLAGGGALNPTLVAMLRERLPAPVRTFEEAGYDAKDREPLAFGVMAYCAWHGLTNTLPAATGARHAVRAGKLSLPPGVQPPSPLEPPP